MYNGSDKKQNLVYDGELLVKKNGKILSRKEGNGILNKAVKGTISKEEAENVIVRLWDVVSEEQFYKKFAEFTMVDRFYALKIHHSNARKQFKEMHKIDIIQTYTVKSEEELLELLETVIADGKEGLVFKNLDAPWEAKRSNNWIKLKAEHDIELEITAWIEGEGKYKGMLGALTGYNEDENIEVNVGSGFSDAQRKEYTPENTIGKIMTVKYNEVIKAKKKERASLFLGRFIEIREDKESV